MTQLGELAHMAVVDTRAVLFAAVSVATASIYSAYPRWNGQAELENGYGSPISILIRPDVG